MAGSEPVGPHLCWILSSVKCKNRIFPWNSVAVRRDTPSCLTFLKLLSASLSQCLVDGIGRTTHPEVPGVSQSYSVLVWDPLGMREDWWSVQQKSVDPGTHYHPNQGLTPRDVQSSPAKIYRQGHRALTNSWCHHHFYLCHSDKCIVIFHCGFNLHFS